VPAVAVPVREFDVLLAEVELELHQGGILDEGGAEGVDLVAEPTPELLQGEAVGPGVICVNEIANRLGLGEVPLAMEKGALGEFPWQGRPATGVNQALHQPSDDEGTAVDVAFHHVFAREALRPPEGQDQRLVEGTVAIHELP